MKNLRPLVNPFNLEVVDVAHTINDSRPDPKHSYIPYKTTYNEPMTVDKRLTKAVKELWFRFASSNANDWTLLDPFKFEEDNPGVAEAIIGSIKSALNIISAFLCKLDISNYFGRSINELNTDEVNIKQNFIDKIYIDSADIEDDMLTCGITYAKTHVETCENINVLRCFIRVPVHKNIKYSFTKNLGYIVSLGVFNEEKEHQMSNWEITACNYINSLIETCNVEIVKHIFNLLVCDRNEDCSECRNNRFNCCNYEIANALDYGYIKSRLIEDRVIAPVNNSNPAKNFRLNPCEITAFNRYNSISKRMAEHSIAIADYMSDKK